MRPDQIRNRIALHYNTERIIKHQLTTMNQRLPSTIYEKEGNFVSMMKLVAFVCN